MHGPHFGQVAEHLAKPAQVVIAPAGKTAPILVAELEGIREQTASRERLFAAESALAARKLAGASTAGGYVLQFPRLAPHNAAVQELRDWIAGERAAVRLKLEGETDPTAIYRLQGGPALLGELAQSIDPEHRRYEEG